MRRCSICILPEVYPNISFDEKGECNFCKTHQKIQFLGKSKLKEDLLKNKKDKGKYDCLVPVSGGKDSTFVLYQMSKVYQMRVLAFNYDNRLTHPQAQENVRKIVNYLGVDLVIKKNKKQKKYMAINLRAYLRKPSVGMIPMLCTGCRYGIIGNAFNIAKEYDIPMIIIGWSPIEDTPFKEVYLKDNGNSVIGGLLRNLIKNPAYIRPNNMIGAVKDYYHSYQQVKDWNIVLKMLHPNVKLIQFYDYVPYNPDEIENIVERELSWETPDKKDSWQFDCKIKLLQNYFYEKELGFTATDCYLSAMVREGFISRSEALERLKYSKQNKDKKLNQLHEFLKDINMEDLIFYFS
ncbi:MAG: 7-cyano-7-deazaguanine synthase [Nitrospirae bacterium]|nr:7-cyano-7-deazaguanine synthase [Nitrospirota bacterium]